MVQTCSNALFLLVSRVGLVGRDSVLNLISVEWAQQFVLPSSSSGIKGAQSSARCMYSFRPWQNVAAFGQWEALGVWFWNSRGKRTWMKSVKFLRKVACRNIWSGLHRTDLACFKYMFVAFQCFVYRASTLFLGKIQWHRKEQVFCSGCLGDFLSTATHCPSCEELRGQNEDLGWTKQK